MEHTPNTFTGLIPEQPRPTDYVEGVNSPLAAAEVMPTGEWTRYASKYERQNLPFETFNCTAFSLTNALEFWLNFYIETDQLPQTHIDFLLREGYVDEGGGVNFSERALGSWAGTTSAGNRMTTVIDTARKDKKGSPRHGLASNKLWPFEGRNLDEYYAAPPKEVEEQAARFLEYFQINYEWTGGYAEALRQCPLWIALCTCGGWSNPPVAWCNAGDATNHAVCLTKYDMVNDPVIVDHYPPYVKELALNYNIPYALKVFIKPINMTNSLVVKKGGEYGIYDPATSADGLITIMRNRGIQPPLKADGTLDFTEVDKLVAGSIV